MIYVCQGHEKGIGLEVFVKSFFELSSDQQKNFKLVCSKKSLQQTLLTIKSQKYEIDKIPCIFLDENFTLPESTQSLALALDLLDPRTDILLTLPTSKDQLIYQNKKAAGYTEYLRLKYQDPFISMFFKSDQMNTLLITDHIPLRDVPDAITEDLIIGKISATLEGHARFFGPLSQIFIAGINPHAGENGILGHEDQVISKSIAKLETKFHSVGSIGNVGNVKFKGPISGDTCTFALNKDKKDELLVYMYHDQGLAPFKAMFGLIGLNISFGLPFLRISVDHGTAFELYGRDCADHRGCRYMLAQALLAQEHLNH